MVCHRVTLNWVNMPNCWVGQCGTLRDGRAECVKITLDARSLFLFAWHSLCSALDLGIGLIKKLLRDWFGLDCGVG